MYRLHDSTVKLRIMYEGTEKIKKYEIRLFVTETTKNLMNLMISNGTWTGHIWSHIVTHRHNKPAISQTQNAGNLPGLCHLTFQPARLGISHKLHTRILIYTALLKPLLWYKILPCGEVIRFPDKSCVETSEKVMKESDKDRKRTVINGVMRRISHIRYTTVVCWIFLSPHI